MDNPIIPMNDFVNHPVEHGGSEVEVLDEALLDEPDHMDMGIKAPFNANPELDAAFGEGEEAGQAAERQDGGQGLLRELQAPQHQHQEQQRWLKLSCL